MIRVYQAVSMGIGECMKVEVCVWKVHSIGLSTLQIIRKFFNIHSLKCNVIIVFFFLLSYRKLQESSSSHNIPHVILPPEPKQPSQLLSYSASNTMDLCNSPTTAHPSGTPQFKKKLISDKHAQQPVQSKRESCGSVTKHQSFDYASSKRPHSLLLCYFS